jgi:death-on-curing protein
VSVEWQWVDPHVLRAIHKSQIARHGGLDGVRDAGLIESALARPQNLAAYGDPDAADLAAAYACGIAKNHGFLDGNKRTALVVALLFLANNGFDTTVDQVDVVRLMESVADGTTNEAAAADWFRSRLVR